MRRKDSRNCSSETLIWKPTAPFISIMIRLSHAPAPSRIARAFLSTHSTISSSRLVVGFIWNWRLLAHSNILG
jgi:hypothetical protein